METRKLQLQGLIIVKAFLLVSVLSFGQVNMTSSGSYSQDFNSLATSGSNNNFTNNSTIASWYIQREDNNATPNTYAASTGSSSTGSFYSFGSSGNSERALGTVNSGSTDDMAIGLLLRNTSGVTISSVTVSYSLEQWRKGNDSQQGITFSYQTSFSPISNLSPDTNTGWTSVSGLDLNGPVSSGQDNVNLNGNTNKVSANNVTLTGLNLSDGQYIMLRWRDINHSGNDHGLAIDDVTVNFTVPSFIFLNNITTNNNSANPYTTNQVVDANATATGIGRGSGISYEASNGAYAANSFTTSNAIGSDDYFYFTITPNVGYQLNFISFDYQEQRTDNDSPEDFSFRSSIDNYGSAIQNYTLTNQSPTNRSIVLDNANFQNVQAPITFRLYGYDASGSNTNDREYQINNFAFLGTVSMIPPTVSSTNPTTVCDNASGQVTINGNNLIHVSSVTVGGTPVTITNQSNTQITVTVPQGISGQLVVTNDAGSANGEVITLLNAVTYYADTDGDGFGDPSVTVSNCTGQPIGFVLNNLDCDDTLITYEDGDNDGFGSLIMVPCGGVSNSLDTNDALLSYVDADNDGYGSEVLAPSGVTNSSDCNDNDSSINPGATEICYDDIDQNCDGDLNDGCSIILAQLRNDNCGASLTTITQTLRGDLFSNPIPQGVSVNGYRFRVTNLSTNEVRVVERSNYVFQISTTDIAQYGTAYSIEVAVRLNSQWMPFGGVCNVVTPDVPNTTIANTSCGSTLVQMNNIIRAVVVPSAVNYEYEVSLIEGGIPVETTTLIRPGASFNLQQLTGISLKFGAEYQIRVKVEVPTAIGLQWSTNYGAPCSVISPFAPESQIEGCGNESGIYPPALNTVIYATPIGGATQYRFTLSDGNGYNQVFTASSRTFRLSNFDALEALTPGASYSITIETQVYGFYYSGKDCNVTVPGILTKGVNTKEVSTEVIEEEDYVVQNNSVKMVAYPNPYIDYFHLKADHQLSDVQVAIYDMSGRCIANFIGSGSELNDIQWGEQFPSGIYSAIVTYGTEVKTIRVVKQ